MVLSKAIFIISLLFILTQTITCSSQQENRQTHHQIKSAFKTKAYDDYWYQNKAEINYYELDQARYGEMRKGKALLIFVTEDFRTDTQVKVDHYEGDKPMIPILKMISIKKFNTGVYDYSIFGTAFKPLDIETYPKLLKTSVSTQEWCGTVYQQGNLIDNAYKIISHSYFEMEGDRETQVNDAVTEEDLWMSLRFSPEIAPQGDISVIGNGMITRLMHLPIASEAATTILKENDASTSIYDITFTESQRHLKITFEKSFPYKITSWTETYKSGFGDKAKELTTSAVLKKTIMLDYWTKNGTEHQYLREFME